MPGTPELIALQDVRAARLGLDRLLEEIENE